MRNPESAGSPLFQVGRRVLIHAGRDPVCLAGRMALSPALSREPAVVMGRRVPEELVTFNVSIVRGRSRSVTFVALKPNGETTWICSYW